MFPKLKIESGKISITGECIEEIPYQYGVQWKEHDSGFNTGNLYKFELEVNGDKGDITISDEVLKTLNKREFQELLLSELHFNTNVMEFSIILKDWYKFWLEMS